MKTKLIRLHRLSPFLSVWQTQVPCVCLCLRLSHLPHPYVYDTKSLFFVSSITAAGLLDSRNLWRSIADKKLGLQNPAEISPHSTQPNGKKNWLLTVHAGGVLRSDRMSVTVNLTSIHTLAPATKTKTRHWLSNWLQWYIFLLSLCEQTKGSDKSSDIN